MNNRLQNEARETRKLRNEALQLGIDIPRHSHWWFNDDDELVAEGASVDDLELIRTEYLTDEGMAGVKKLIKDEKRRNWEWRLKVVGSIIALITGLLGTLIGVLAFLKK